MSDVMAAQFSTPSSLPPKSEFSLNILLNAWRALDRVMCVPWQGALFSAVEIRADELGLQSEALRAGRKAAAGLKRGGGIKSFAGKFYHEVSH